MLPKDNVARIQTETLFQIVNFNRKSPVWLHTFELEDNLICPPLFEPTPLCKTTSDDVSAGPELIVICPDISESVDKIET